MEEKITKASAQEAEAIFNAKIAQQKKVLKGLSKNQLIRIVVDLSIKSFYLQSEIHEFKKQIGGSNEVSDSNSSDATKS